LDRSKQPKNSGVHSPCYSRFLLLNTLFFKDHWQLKVVAQSSLGQDARNFDWKAAVAASLQLKGERRLRKEQEIQLLEAAVDVAENRACIDQNTPEDGHCLFHALKQGGLFQAVV